jgi:hypothetical protein
MSEHELKFAARAVRNLAAEQGGTISAREAHDAWRWALVSRGWKPGDGGAKARQCANLVAFDKLPEALRGHALEYLGEDDAEQDDSLGDTEELDSGAKGCC